jgi:phosphate transport system substrate-binding protein
MADRKWQIIFLQVVLLTLPACTSLTATPPPPVLITGAGSTAMQPLVAGLARSYTERQPQVSFDIQGGASLLGQRLVENEQVDLGMVSWPPEELAVGMRLIPVARDGIAIIVHPENRPEGLSFETAQDIFSGRLLSWQELDGPAWPIQVVSREEGSGTRAAFEAQVMIGQPVTSAAVVLPNSRAVVEFVAEQPGAVAYVSQAFVDETVAAVPLDGITPTLEAITANHYPLVRELALLVPTEPRPEVARFIEFVLSPGGQELVKERWAIVQ